MLKVIGLFLSSYVLAGLSLAAPQVVTADVTFHAVGSPGFVTIDGGNLVATGSVSQSLGKVEGSFDCNLTTLKTGIALRDRHAKEKYLQTDKYPSASLVVSPSTVTPGEFPWSGLLTLKGVTKAVTGVATVTGQAFKATLSVSLDDFNVGVPSYLGVTVAKTVDVTVSGTVK